MIYVKDFLIKTLLFNLAFEDFDNTEFKKKYSNQTKLIFFKIFKREKFSYLSKSAKISEAPSGLFTLGMVKLFRNIKKKIKAVLNGQGIDEIFEDIIYFLNQKNKIYHPDGTVLQVIKLFIRKI